MKQTELRIKKRPSISKPSRQKQLSMTMSTAMFPVSQKQLKQLPPIKRNLRKPLQKITNPPKSSERKFRNQTQTTLNQSTIAIQQSHFFTTLSKGWIKPSDYQKDIEQLNMEEGKLDVGSFEIKLSDKMENNVKKIELLFELTKKWVEILKRALLYVSSQKSSSQKLSEEVKFWRLLSKKFDELEYEFNNQKTTKLNQLMKTNLKTNPEHRKTLEEYQGLKQRVTKKCVQIKRLYMSLQEVVAGAVLRFQQCSDIVESIGLLKRVLLSISSLAETNGLLEGRLEIIYRKANMALIAKLLAAPIYPRELANISGLKIRYQLIDNAASFYSNFVSILQEKVSIFQEKDEKFRSIIDQAEYTRQIISNLMEILCYFEYLYKKKQVLEFSKLFSYEIDFNIFDPQNTKEWQQYMALVQESMLNKHYQP